MDWTHIEIKWNEMARRLQSISPPPSADNVIPAAENVTRLRSQGAPDGANRDAGEDVARVAV